MMEASPTNKSTIQDPIPIDNEFYITIGGLVYAILSTTSLFFMIILSIIYGRLDHNRIFVYFCVSMVTLYIPHVLGAWIYGANLHRASQAICWIQALWINASGITAGFAVSIFSFDIYRNIVLRTTESEWLRQKYYIAISIILPLLIGIIPPALIAEKSNGILPGPYFCVLYKPEIVMAFVSIQGWNTLTSLFGIYFSTRTAFVVVKIICIRNFRNGFDKPKASQRIPLNTSTQNAGIESNAQQTFTTIPISNFQDYENESNSLFASMPIYVCMRLVSFGVLYCAVTILVYGRNLILSIKRVPYDPNKPFMEYIIASLGILLFIVFGTSMEAIRAYWKFAKIIISCQWLKRLLKREESFADWEIQKAKGEEMERLKS